MEIRLALKYFLYFITLIIFQLALFNNMIIGDDFYPFVLILFLLLLPINLSDWVIVIITFVAGLIYDAFNNTLALNTSALLIVGLFRNFIIRKMTPRDGYQTIFPSIFNNGILWFVIYSGLLIFTYEIFVNIFDIMSFRRFFEIILKTLINTVYSFVFVILFHLLFYKNKS